PKPTLMRAAELVAELPFAHRHRQGVLADDAHRRQPNVEGHRTVMAVGEQRIGLDDIVGGDLPCSVDLRKQPHHLAVAKIAASLVNGVTMSEYGIEKERSVAILKRLEAAMSDTKNAGVMSRGA